MTTEKRTNCLTFAMAGLLAMGMLACGTESNDDRPWPNRIGSIQRDLTVGSIGNDVRALHRYLTRYGYFPNPELAADYPRWRPAVATVPAHESVFDAGTADAVRQLQLNTGLAPTGIVDAATRELLATPRCGVPDTMVDLDPSDKWALNSNITSNTLLHKWSLLNTHPNFTAAQIKQEINAAAATLMFQTSLTIREDSSSGARIDISFADLGPRDPVTGGATGAVTAGGGTNAVTLRINNNSDISWTVGNQQPVLQDMQTVILHELGHAMGLSHSAFKTPSRATMYPTALQIDRSLDVDDNVALSALWDTYQQLPGGGIDIGAGANGAVWLVGGDNRLYWWDADASNWIQANNGLAVRVAVDPQGVPWVTASDTTIWKRTTNSPTVGDWQRMPGLAFDVGIGANGDVWVVGTDANVYKWNPAINNWNGIAASARRIAVSPTGKPYIVTTSSGVQRLTTNNPSTGTWEVREAPAEDIGVGGGFPINQNPLAGQDGVAMKTDRGSLLVLDEQKGFNNGDGNAPTVDPRWRIAGDNRGSDFRLPSGPIAVSVGPNGKPWVIGTNGAIYTTVR